MFKEKLLIGQYYPSGSPLHSLNARAKIISSLIYMIALFVGTGWIWWGLCAAICLAAAIVARIPLAALWRGLKLIVIFALLTMVLNFFFYPGEHIIWSWKSLTLSQESLSYGLAMGLRLVLLVMFASLLTLTTSPMEITDGLEELLLPLKRFKVPAHEIAMMMSIALRFIPTILEEFDRIVLAQKARGAKIGQGNIMRRLTSFIPLLIPLFVSAFRRAEDLAQAMEAKCYQGGEGRSKWKTHPWQKRDTMTVAGFGVFFLAGLILRIVL